MKNIFLSLLFILSLFLISQFIFTPTHLYYEIWWLDIPMHILGGAGVAMLAVSVLKYFNKEISFSRIILFVMIVGVVWEIYEYSMHYFLGYDWNGMLDTIKDLVDDFLGASLVYFFSIKKLLTTNH